MGALNWADYVILGIVVLSVLISLWRGLLKEVLGLAIWLAAFWVAFNFADETQGFFINSISVPSARMAVAFALLFLAALIVGGLLNFLLGKLIKTTGLSGTDRFFGMFFGLARAGVLMVALVLAAGFTPIPKDPWWQQSVLLPYFESLAGWSVQFLPESVRPYFSPEGLSPEEKAAVDAQDPALESEPDINPDGGTADQAQPSETQPPPEPESN